MKFRNLGLALFVAASCQAASAEDLNFNIPLVLGADGNLSAPLAASHLLAGAFTDTFNFGTLTRDGFVNLSLNTIGTTPVQDIDFVSATLNGIPFSFTRINVGGITNAVEVGSFTNTFFPAGTELVLTIVGFAGEGLTTGSSIAASYTGNINVVPEPHAAMMFVAGLAVVGWLVRRRRT